MIDLLENWWQALNQNEQIFWIIAMIASILFIIQVIFSFSGLDSDLDMDADVDIDGGLSVISFRGIVAFCLFFGWTGVLCLSNGVDLSKTIMISFLAGFMAMVVIAYLFTQFLKLQETGNIKPEQLLEATGEVYLKIPTGGEAGKVLLQVAGKTMEFDARTGHNEVLDYGRSVKVVDIKKGNLLIVEPIN